jgi:acetyl-CoA synthetase
LESALVAHPAVAESAVVGIPHEMKGQGLAAFVILKSGFSASDALKKELSDQIAREIGSFARPDQIRFAEGLPKTRSGKIMRRLLKEVASGGGVKGDVTTLEDFNVIAKLSASDEG